MLSSVAKDMYLKNHSKATHYPQNYLLNFFIVLLFENSPNKASGLPFIFVRMSTGHAHFVIDEICISWVPMEPSMVFFTCRIPEKSAKKSGLEVCGWPLRPILNPEKKPTLNRISNVKMQSQHFLVMTVHNC